VVKTAKWPSNDPRTGGGDVYDGLMTWLREKGVTALKPLHELRKEFGSTIANEHGIFAASRALRHADIAITSQHYADKTRRVTTGFGKMLGGVEAAAT